MEPRIDFGKINAITEVICSSTRSEPEPCKSMNLNTTHILQPARVGAIEKMEGQPLMVSHTAREQSNPIAGSL